LYAAHVEDPENTKGTSLEDHSVLQEFEDVFQEIFLYVYAEWYVHGFTLSVIHFLSMLCMNDFRIMFEV
jgi:hypothetical protein